eukprot:357343-Chlamydomonas_euryale.AAC.3
MELDCESPCYDSQSRYTVQADSGRDCRCCTAGMRLGRRHAQAVILLLLHKERVFFVCRSVRGSELPSWSPCKVRKTALV